MMKEEWRDIPGYEGYYQVSNLGRVKSMPRLTHVIGITRKDGKLRNETWNRPGRVLKPIYPGNCSNPIGYVHLHKDGQTRESIAVKRIVAKVFLDDFDESITTNRIKIKDMKKGYAVSNLYIEKESKS